MEVITDSVTSQQYTLCFVEMLCHRKRGSQPSSSSLGWRRAHQKGGITSCRDSPGSYNPEPLIAEGKPFRPQIIVLNPEVLLLPLDAYHLALRAHSILSSMAQSCSYIIPYTKTREKLIL